MTSPHRTVVVVAAGAGQRLGDRRPKALVELTGTPLVGHALDAVAASGVEEVVVVGPPDRLEDLSHACGPHRVDALVAGGPTRTSSVRAGLAAVSPRTTVVGIHDAARPLTPPEVIAAALDAVVGDVIAAAPARPVADTLKQTRGGEVVATVDRDGVMAVQTPQAFRRDVLEAVHAWAGDGAATDDLALVEQARHVGVVAGRIALVAGSPLGFKVTYPADLDLARMLLSRTPTASTDRC